MTGDPSADVRLDRPMLVFTDEHGAVVLIEDDLARALGNDRPDEALGDPLAAALGMSTHDAETLLNEISAKGSARPRLAQVSNRRTGQAWWVLLSGTAPPAGGRFIGADITVTPPLYALPADDLDHRRALEGMAAIVRNRMRNGSAPTISEEKELELRSYFAARMLAIYVLTVRMGGRAVGGTLEDKVRRLNQTHHWSMEMTHGRLTFGEGGLRPEACQEIMHVAIDYAARITSRRLVARELAELDVNFPLPTVQRAAQFGLRDDL